MTAAATESNKQLNALIDKVDELAVLPHVVFKVLEITGQEEAPATDIEKTIIVDPGFSSKVLVLANSASYGLPKRVSSIRDAVMFLGFRTVRTIALTVGVFDLFVGKNDTESLRRRAWWRQSIDTAVCAKVLAAKIPEVNKDDAYTCGLLHLIGKSLLDRVGGKDYGLISRVVELGVPDYMAERELYGCTHAEVASAAARKWGLPTDLQSGLLYLVQPCPTDEYQELRACTALASALTRLVRDSGDASQLPHWAMEKLGIPIESGPDLLANAAIDILSAQHSS